MSSNSPKFTCASCGKEFRWKPEIAGRKAKCKCGQTLTVPATPPAPKVAAPAPNIVAPSPEPNPLDWSDEPAADYAAAPPAPAASGPRCPSCGAGLPANAVLCVNCGYNLKTGKKIGGVASAAPAAASASLAAPAPAGAPPLGGPGAAYAGTYKRAKIDQVTTVEEETSSWQGYLTILAGVGALGLGVWQLVSPHDPGDPSVGRRRGRWFREMIRWLYDIGGNGAVVGAFALIGLGLIAFGLLQVRKKISTDD
jgi:hypothetical protein